MRNKYYKFFNKDMSTEQVSYTFFSLLKKNMKLEDKQMLTDAKKHFYEIAFNREMKLAREGWMF